MDNSVSVLQHRIQPDWVFPEWAYHVATPAFVFDENDIINILDDAIRHRDQCGMKLLFAIKSFSFVDALSLMTERIDGFATSSLFEARLARHAVRNNGTVNITSPGLRPNEMVEIAGLCDAVAFNSLGQWDLHHEMVKWTSSCGIRVNPQLSFVQDHRYDPCRTNSKLGVPVEVLDTEYRRRPDRFDGLEGILFHTNCESSDYGDLESTVFALDDAIPNVLEHLKWVNMGGGYLMDGSSDYSRLYSAVQFLQAKYGVDVLLEPGAALIRDAGYIVSTVLDMFDSGGRTVVVLDTSINHMPETFEFGYQPDVAGHDPDGEYSYILAGSTCLAGDLFGEYRFNHELHVGGRVLFEGAGAYTMVKSHMFNGIALPTVYKISTSGDLELRVEPKFDDFAGRWGMRV